MEPDARIAVVTVNHNTSHFVELMLRTLRLTDDLAALPLDLVVLDNRSEDAHVGELRAYLAAQGIPLVQTGFDSSVAVEKHGDALAGFVAGHAQHTHYLFLDADMWFVEPGTVATMLGELARAPGGTFAVQARIRGYYAGRVIEGRGGVPGASDGGSPATVSVDGRVYTNVAAPRCSPVCSLVANTPLFRRVVESVGLAPAQRFGVGRRVYYDTFGLMTQVMATHGCSFVVSARTVNHFTQVAYVPEHRAAKDADCLELLGELRAGRGMERPEFYESAWARRQRGQP